MSRRKLPATKPLAIWCAIGLILAACARGGTTTEASPPTPSATRGQPAATEAPSETPKPSAIPAQSPTPTNTPFLSPTPEPPLVGPLVAIVSDTAKPTMYILDMTLGFSRRLQFEGGLIVQAQWIGDGCQLYVTLLDTSQPSLEPPYTDIYKVVRTDLEGNILEEVFTYPQFREVGGERDVWRTSTAISPTGDWLASVVKSGDFWNQQLESVDVEVISTRNEGQRYVLTDGGDAAHIAWSPDGTRLAFDDRDAAGVRQFYVANLDGTGKVQVTHFTEAYPDVPYADSGLTLSDPVWSPDGRLLAFSYKLTDEGPLRTGSVWIVSATGDRQIQVIPEGLPEEPVKEWLGTIIGWSEDSARLALNIGLIPQDGGEYITTVYWIDAVSGSAFHVLNGSEVPKGYIDQVFTAGGINTLATRTGAGSWDLYLYDSLTGSLEYVPVQNQPDIRQLLRIIESPYNFPGEAACKAQADIQAP